jgi:squalene-associated FAD-dependent desaturase
VNVAVIGAGLAGLAAACNVAGAGGRAIVLERRPWAGGKTYSFAERETGEAVDNGQHIAMRCTTEYADFLRQIGSAHLIRWQDRLRVPVFDAEGGRSDLAASALPAPLHLGPSFVRYAHLAMGDKLRIARAILAMRRMSERDRALCDGVSFAAWLRSHGQSETGIRDFWDLIIVPALNCRSEDASASQALFVFREGFLKSAQSAAVGVPSVGLSALHVEPAVRYIEERGGEVRIGDGVEQIEIEDRRARAVRLVSGERIVADACVCALPPKQALAVLPEDLRLGSPFGDLAKMHMSPIANVHLWFDGPVADFPFAAFVGSDVQWVFRPRASAPAAGDEHVVVSLSAAEKYLPMTKTELVELLLPQLRRALPAMRGRELLRSAVIKEPDATFVPSPELRRPGVRTPIANLMLAGAHLDTGWPATMESAVRSGRMAARAVMGMRENQRQAASRDAVAV